MRMGIGVGLGFARSSGLPGVEILTDGDCEAADVAAWIVFNAATLTKSTDSPHGGARALRVARSTTNNPAARVNQTAGKSMRIIGYARGDGTRAPRVFDAAAGAVWTGTASTSWQAFDVSYTAGAFVLLQGLMTVAGWVEFDDMHLRQLD